MAGALSRVEHVVCMGDSHDRESAFYSCIWHHTVSAVTIKKCCVFECTAYVYYRIIFHKQKVWQTLQPSTYTGTNIVYPHRLHVLSQLAPGVTLLTCIPSAFRILVILNKDFHIFSQSFQEDPKILL
jgi:hypothetical protein